MAAKRAYAIAYRRKVQAASGNVYRKNKKAETASRRTAYQSYCAEMKEDAIRLLEEYKFSDRESQRYTQRLSNEEDWAAFRLLLLLRCQQHVKSSMKNDCLVPKCGREFLPGDAGKWRHMWYVQAVSHGIMCDTGPIRTRTS